jgi:ABC-type nitrate/sulfonate/bicarbonate transport system permease component
MKRDVVIVVGAALFLFALLALWQAVAGLRLISPVFFPPPTRIADVLYRQVLNGTVWMPLAMTSSRVLLGWSLAVAVGVVVGAVIGLSAKAADYLEGPLEFLRTMPASAVLPIFIMVMGLTNEMIVAVIVFGSL